MSLIDQFVCNKCYRPKISNIRNFYITQCGHIFCDKCSFEGGDTCQRCQTSGIQSLQLTDSPPPSIAHLLTPRHEFLENMAAVARFQFNQKIIMAQLQQKQQEKYAGLKQAYWDKRKELLKIQQTKAKLQKATDQLLAEKHQRQQAATSAAPGPQYVKADNFFHPGNAVSKNFGQAQQNQRADLNFGRKVAFVTPSDPYNANSSRMIYSPSVNTNTPSSNVNSLTTPATVRRMTTYQRGHMSTRSSGAPSSINSSNINLF